MSLLRRAADFCPTMLYERHGPIVELNRLAQPESLAAGRLSKKITKILLRLVSVGDLGLQ